MLLPPSKASQKVTNLNLTLHGLLFFFFTVRVNYIRTIICHEPTQLGAAASIRACVCVCYVDSLLPVA